jgi:hypothetical protein
MTPAHERKAAERQRKKAAGLVRCEVWVKPEHRAVILAVAQDVNAGKTLIIRHDVGSYSVTNLSVGEVYAVTNPLSYWKSGKQ